MRVFTHLNRNLTTVGALLLLFFLALSTTVFSQETDIGQKIAQAYGIQGFKEIKQIKFTFNVKKGDNTLSRTWVWYPSKDLVSYIKDADKHEAMSYNRKEITPESPDVLKVVDSSFTNDQYWLLFPFHLVWDKGITIKADDEKVKLPVGDGMARKVTVTYPNEGGYTPGDVYELFIDDNNMILQWIYRRGGAQEPTAVATWEDNRSFGPITLSLNHISEENDFRIWFTDVVVTMSETGERIKSD